MTKEKLLQKIALNRIRLAEMGKVGKHGKAVPGEGNADADIFVGEVPGRNEAEQGDHLSVGQGKLLRKMIERVVNLTERRIDYKSREVFARLYNSNSSRYCPW